MYIIYNFSNEWNKLNVIESIDSNLKMHNEIFYDLKSSKQLHTLGQKKKTELSLFVTISPMKNDLATHFPMSSLVKTDNFVLRAEKRNEYMKFYSKHITEYSRIFESTYIAIAVDKDLRLCKMGILNLVDIKYGTEIKRVFLTNFSFIKQFIEKNLKEFNVYMINNRDHTTDASSLLAKVEYITKNIQEVRDRELYFNELIQSNNLKELQVDENFLKIRGQLLKRIQSELKLDIFKDPIRKKIIYPVLDLLAFHSLPQTSTSIILDISTYEGTFARDFKSSASSCKFTFLSYFPNVNFFHRLKEDLNVNYSEIDLFKYLNTLFVDSSISISFGQFDKVGNICLAKYYFHRNFPGFIIYDMNFFPVGIAFTQQNSLSVGNITSSQSEFMKNYNIILPFYNQGVLGLFKEYLGIETGNIWSYDKKTVFGVLRKNHKNEVHENVFLDNILDNGSTSISKLYHPNEFTRISSVDNNNPRQERKITLKKNHFDFTKLDLSMKSLNEARQHFNQKIIERSFSYEPINKIILEQERQREELCKFIDSSIENIYKEEMWVDNSGEKEHKFIEKLFRQGYIKRKRRRNTEKKENGICSKEIDK